MFRPTPAWSSVASRIQVFLITAGYVLQASDADLQAAAADLASHHVDLAIALQSIAHVPGGPCGQQEGYGVVSDGARAAAKLDRLGIKLKYIKLDEPLWFGHYDPSPASCQLPIAATAQAVKLIVQEYLQHFPDAVVGDIEPVPLLTLQPNWQSDFKEFAQAFATATGHRLAFLDTDVAWRTPYWERSVKTVATFVRGLGLEFGVIYKGDGFDTTGAAWVADAIRHFEVLESGGDLIPEQASIQTWDPQPTQVLPETSDATLSHVVLSYVRARTRFTAVQVSPAGVHGLLTAGKGHAMAGVDVALQALGVDTKRPVAVHTSAGEVPADATSALIGIRVNSECFCAGENDLVLGDIDYLEGGQTRQTLYVLPDKARQHQGLVAHGSEAGSMLVGGQSLAHLVVHANQQFGFNSPQFAVTPGAHFEFRVPIGSPSATGLFGTVVIIWFDRNGKGLSRTAITLNSDDDATNLGTAMTDAGGRFFFPNTQWSGQADLKLVFKGDAGFRGAVATVR